MTIRANWNTGDSFTATDANTLAAQVNVNTENAEVAAANAAAALAAVSGFSELGTDLLEAEDAAAARAVLGVTAAAPASATAAGTPGQWAAESGFLYICVATDTWERVAIATWP